MTIQYIEMGAPAPGDAFGAMPSGTSYVADSWGNIYITNNSGADVAALLAVGCQLKQVVAPSEAALIGNSQSAPGTSAGLAIGIQGVARGVPMPVSFASGGGTATVQLAELAAYVVTTLGVAINATAYSALRVQVDAISGGDSIGFTKSLAASGTAYAVGLTDEAGNAYTTITAPGIYLMPARSFITPTHTGTASTPVVTVMAHQ